ncbi:MAG TPA: hydrogenase maturation protease [Terriglobales bacterium]|nr:hydrogenase maturation protease [Terriglobales bacterium]
MLDLRQQLESLARGRVCFVGLGNPDFGDDGFGVRMAEDLHQTGVPHVVVAGVSPERWLSRLADPQFAHVVFLDAVEFGGAPGSVVLLNGREAAARFPQVSTHKISLSLLAEWIESNGATHMWLLGVQPESIRESAALSPAVRESARMIRGLLLETLSLPARNITADSSSEVEAYA